MESINKNTTDGNMDILLAKYILREADSAECEEVERWITSNQENRKYTEQLGLIWYKCRSLQFNGNANIPEGWQRVHHRINEKPSRLVYLMPFRKMRWIAAALIVILITGGLSLLTWHSDKRNNTIILRNVSGAAQTDSLPDGSLVTLAANSCVTYSAQFPGNQRNVKLTGDAYFIVAHDTLKPFSVAVNDILVTVLGTSFNIRSAGGKVEIAVKTGIVQVSRRHQQIKIYAFEKLTLRQSDSLWSKEPDSSADMRVRNVISQTPPASNIAEEKNRPQPHSFQAPVPVQEKPLHALLVGDDAPILPLDVWIKGGPINLYEKGKVYLVDFWALWCGPCIAGMEHLSQLQKKYKYQGLEVMSVTSEDAWGNSFEKVKDFINSKGEKFNYNFAWLPLSYRQDHKYKSIIYNRWLELAYDSSSWALPQVFLIDRNGKFAFIGDGYNLSEGLIEKVLNDDYDISEERKHYIEKISLENKVADFSAFMDNKNISKAIDIARTIVQNPLVTPHTLLSIADEIFNKYKNIQSNNLLSLGFEAAKKGVEVTESKSPGHLSLLAKGYSLLNKPEQSVKIMKSAISLAEGDFKEALEKDLQVYEQQVKNKSGN